MSQQPTQAEVDTLLRALVRILAGVAVLALVFTAVNVTLFATDHHIPWPIALLLDPMVALTLTTVLYADARLAAWGIPPPRWSTALRWSAGLAATVMNTWTSLWPDEHIGWPRRADPAGVLLHSVPPLLLIGLTETVAAYRRCTTHLHPHTATAPRQVHPHPTPAPLREQHWNAPGAPAPARQPHPTPHPRPRPIPNPDPDPGALPELQPHPHPTGDGPQETPARPDRPHPAANAPAPRSGTDSRADAELYAQALALDAAARQSTGQPVSIRQLRHHLHLGQRRARELRTRLDTHRAPGAPASHTAPGTMPGTAPHQPTADPPVGVSGAA
ncbi:hypothetical protein PS467_09285 [Streptomyces luomodiensis]|uniref:Extensin n=1 Tax=Streptomyces luomodiensis TaxID=3026192 RepID=A0ABY9UVM3_9ACTN|nr:hypothetical protein [Streptomyces sp. SCA4-21]WNE95523.1 hypothetical protein PS467_09285 [Streptomyces sp. SCA4-21]